MLFTVVQKLGDGKNKRGCLGALDPVTAMAEREVEVGIVRS